MTTRSYMATHNQIAVSANLRETAINTEQTLDTKMLCALGDIVNIDPRRESNENEATGTEEPTRIDDLGKLASVSLNFEKAQVQHLALLYAYGLGNVVTTAAGAGKLHTITPIDGDLDTQRSCPSFTGAQRLGKTVIKRRFASMFVDSLTATFARDSWVKAAGAIKATGKVTSNVVEEVVAAAGNVTSLTLAALGVEGADAAARLQNVQRIRVELSTGVWTEVVYSAVSAAAPAVITIVAPAVPVTVVNFRILYIPTESGWMTFPSEILETPLRVSEMTLRVGGGWSGSAFVGGRAFEAEMQTLEHTLNNALKIEFVPGAGGLYASSALRDGRSQQLKLNREFRDAIFQQHLDANDTLAVYVLAEGAVYDSPHKYQAELIFPKVGVITAPINVNGKRLAEAGDLKVLQHETYGSIIARFKNLQATYAA